MKIDMVYKRISQETSPEFSSKKPPLPGRLSTAKLLGRPSQVQITLRENIIQETIRKLPDGTMGVVTFVWGRGIQTDPKHGVRRISVDSVLSKDSVTDFIELDCKKLNQTPQLCLKYLDLSGYNEVVGTIITSQFMNTPAFCFLSPKEEGEDHPLDPIVTQSSDDFILNNFFLSHEDHAIPMLMEFLSGHNCVRENVESLSAFFTPKSEEFSDLSDLSKVKLYQLGMQAANDWLIHNTDRFRWGHLFHKAIHLAEKLTKDANLGNIFFDSELRNDWNVITQEEQIRCIDNMIGAFYYDTDQKPSEDRIKDDIQSYAKDVKRHLESLKKLPLDRISISELQETNPELVESVKQLVFSSLDIPEPTDAMLYFFFRGLRDKAQEIGSPDGKVAIDNAMIMLERQIPGSTLDSVKINVFSTPSNGKFIPLRSFLTPIMESFTQSHC